jgi:thiol-disulfide isomerase/thioredoxin
MLSTFGAAGSLTGIAPASAQSRMQDQVIDLGKVDLSSRNADGRFDSSYGANATAGTTGDTASAASGASINSDGDGLKGTASLALGAEAAGNSDPASGPPPTAVHKLSETPHPASPAELSPAASDPRGKKLAAEGEWESESLWEKIAAALAALEPEGLSWLWLCLAGLLAVASFHANKQRDRRAAVRTLMALGVVSLGLFGTFRFRQSEPVPAYEDAPWITDEVKAQAQSKARQAPIVIDFGASWCESCRVMEQTVLADPQVRLKLARFVRLKLDVSEDNEANRAKLKRYGVSGLPAFVLIDPTGAIREDARVRGVIPKAEFLRILDTL